MGERLKFSYGHVIAFISLMFIGYVTFMGAIYFSGANFEWAMLAVLVEVVGLFALLMLLQKMKTIKKNFKSNIWKERALVLFLGIGCIFAFTYFMKFWNVFENRNIVSERFSAATAAADSMFSDYDSYCAMRIGNHESRLHYYYNLSSNQLLYQVDDSMLCIMLQSESYRNLEKEAKTWIASTSNGVSVWNVFMMGNEKKMATIIGDWHDMLVSLSEGQVSTEDNVIPFDSDNKSINTARDKIASLEELFSTDGFTPWSLIGIPFFILLFLPYIIQDRYFRSTYILCYPHSVTDTDGHRHTFWGRDKSWVERHISNVTIDTDAATHTTAKVVERMGMGNKKHHTKDVVVHLGSISDNTTEEIVIGGIHVKENKTEKVVVHGIREKKGKRHRKRGMIFDYDKDGEIQSIVTHMND